MSNNQDPLSTPHVVASRQCHKKGSTLRGLSFSTNMKWLITAGYDNNVKLFSLENLQQQQHQEQAKEAKSSEQEQKQEQEENDKIMPEIACYELDGICLGCRFSQSDKFAVATNAGLGFIVIDASDWSFRKVACPIPTSGTWFAVDVRNDIVAFPSCMLHTKPGSSQGSYGVWVLSVKEKENFVRINNKESEEEEEEKQKKPKQYEDRDFAFSVETLFEGAIETTSGTMTQNSPCSVKILSDSLVATAHDSVDVVDFTHSYFNIKFKQQQEKEEEGEEEEDNEDDLEGEDEKQATKEHFRRASQTLFRHNSNASWSQRTLWCLEATRDGKIIIAGSLDSEVFFGCAETGVTFGMFKIAESYTLSLRVSPCDSYVIVGSKKVQFLSLDRKKDFPILAEWKDLYSSKALPKMDSAEDRVYAIDVAKDNNLIALGHETGVCHLVLNPFGKCRFDSRKIVFRLETFGTKGKMGGEAFNLWTVRVLVARFLPVRYEKKKED